MKRLFIVGCPRSGSTWTTHLLARHPAVATFQHAKLFHYLAVMRRWYDSKSPHSFVLPVGSGNGSLTESTASLGSIMGAEDFFASLRGFAGDVLDKVAGVRPEVSVVVDKTPENGGIAEFILKVFPDAYFLHIVRDPRSTYCSLRAASRSWARWEFPTRPVDGGRFWLENVRAAKAIEGLTARYLLVRYEDLLADGRSELERILDWLDLPNAPGFCEEAIRATTRDEVQRLKHLPQGFVRKDAQRDWRGELSRGDVRIIEYLTQEEMRSLGYELSGKPPRSRPFRVWMQDVPEAGLALLDRQMRRATQLMLWGWKGRKLEWHDP